MNVDGCGLGMRGGAIGAIRTALKTAVAWAGCPGHPIGESVGLGQFTGKMPVLRRLAAGPTEKMYKLQRPPENGRPSPFVEHCGDFVCL